MRPRRRNAEQLVTAISNGDPSATTDAAGNYSFSNLPAGIHRVREVLQSNWVQTAPAAKYHFVNLPVGAASPTGTSAMPRRARSPGRNSPTRRRRQL